MQTVTRNEEDLLGVRQIPDEFYYGIHTLRAKENFRISDSKISDYPEFIRGKVYVKKAAAMANSDLGLLSKDIARAIHFACDEIQEGNRHLDQFPVDVFQGGAGTSLNMNVNEVIANVALEYMGLPKAR